MGPKEELAILRLGFLLNAYQVETWYWELVEMIRKLLLTGILVVVYDGSPPQLAGSLLTVFLTVFIQFILTDFMRVFLTTLLTVFLSIFLTVFPTVFPPVFLTVFLPVFLTVFLRAFLTSPSGVRFPGSPPLLQSSYQTSWPATYP